MAYDGGAEAAEMELRMHHKRRRLRECLGSPRLVVLVFGTVPLLLLSVPPVWGALRLLEDPVYVFLHGRWLPERTVTLCVGGVVAYMLSVLLFFRFGAREHKEARALVAGQIIFSLVCITLGMSLLLLSAPLRQEVSASYEELFNNCKAGSNTRNLYEYSESLHKLRATPACAAEVTVEACAGYVALAPYADFLKELESRFECAGFCHVSEYPTPSNFSTTSLAPSINPYYADVVFIPPSVLSSGKWGNITLSEANVSSSPTKGVAGAEIDVEAASAAMGVIKERRTERKVRRHEHVDRDLHRPDHHSPKGVWAEMLDEIGRDIAGPAEPEKLPITDEAGSIEAADAAVQYSRAHDEAGGASLIAARASLLALMPSRGREQPSLAAPPMTAMAPVNPGGLIGSNPFTRLAPPFPSPLFSNASAAAAQKTHKVSCEGMAAWTLGFKALDVARIFFWEGVVILFAMCFGGLFKLSGMCKVQAKLQERLDVIET